jgi:SAM-dependent methyltransferase
MHPSSYENMRKFVDQYLADRQEQELLIIDIGSSDVNGTYKPLFSKTKWQYYGCDIADGKNVDYVLKDHYSWKELASNQFDIVISGQAFEHIEYFWVTMLEMARILKEDGMCCIIAPSAGLEHKYPLDCWRFYPDGFRALARYVGLQILNVYTEWHDNFWKDSVLICKKPSMSPFSKIKFDLKNKLSTMAVGIDVLSDSRTSDLATELLELIHLLRANAALFPEIEDALKIGAAGSIPGLSGL